VPTGIQVCSIGASDSRTSFIWDDSYEYVTFNFGLGAQSIVYDYNILQNYKNNISEGATVFITVYLGAFSGVDEVFSEDFEGMNRRYYRFLSNDYIRKYNRETDFLYNYVPFIYEGRVKRIVKGIVQGSADVSGLASLTKTNEEETIGYVEKSITKMNADTNFDSDGSRLYKQNYIDALYDCVNLCKEIGATPVLITCPVLSELTDAMKESLPDYYYRYHEIMASVSDDTGIAYADYSEDERFKNDYSLFSSADHLNRDGGKAFTKIVMEDFGLE
jgi:hypothetical protein